MKTITFISHHNNIRVNIRLNDQKAEKVLNDDPIDLYITDCNRINAGFEPRYFSKYQIRKLDSSISIFDYYSNIEVE